MSGQLGGPAGEGYPRVVMASGISLVVTDLDGTLWDADERVHDRTLAALKDLDRLRLPVLVATGRRLRSAAASLRSHGLDLPAVLLDGALGHDLRDGRRFHEACFSTPDAVTALAAFGAAGLSPAVYVDRAGTDVVVGARPSTHPDHLALIGDWLGRDDLDDVVACEPVYAFVVVDTAPEAIAAVTGHLHGSGTPTVTNGAYFPGSTITVRPPQTSKWEGVLAYCREQQLDATRVLAVGDGENDVELLGGAAVSCVVRDGCEAALALADHVIEPASEGGWSSILSLCGA